MLVSFIIKEYGPAMVRDRVRILHSHGWIGSYSPAGEQKWIG